MSQNKKSVNSSKEQLSFKFKVGKSESMSHSYESNKENQARIYSINNEAYWNKRILERK